MSEPTDEQDRRLREELDRCVELLREDPGMVDVAAESLADVLQDEPVPIYAAPAMAYAAPPVEPLHPRIKQWNQDRGRHPFRGDLLTRRLHDNLLDYDKVAAVLDVLDSVCPVCQDADTGCPCWNDK